MVSLPFIAAGSHAHLGLIQPHGAVLAVRQPSMRIVQASANAGALFGMALDSLLLGPLHQLGGEFAEAVRNLAPAWGDHPVVTLAQVGNGSASRRMQAWLQRVQPDLLLIDLIPDGPTPGPGSTDPRQPLEDAIHALSAAGTFAEVARAALEGLRHLCPHEELRFVRLEPDGQSSVLASWCRDGGAFGADHPELRDLTEPAPLADSQLHALPVWQPPAPYQDRLFVIPDTQADPVGLLPHALPGSGESGPGTLDLSGSALRSPPGLRLGVLRAHGVRAEATVVLWREGRPWGLMACLDRTRPCHLGIEQRLACELLGEAVSTRIAALESAGRADISEHVRRLQHLLVEAASQDGDWRQALKRSPEGLLRPLGATGAALLHDGQVVACGAVPPGLQLRELARWIDEQAPAPVWHREDLRLDCPERAGSLTTQVGALAVKLSMAAADYLMWFRAEDPVPWSARDLSQAAALGEMFVDLIVQVHAVRLLVTGHEFEQLRAKVADSREAVVVCDAQGRVMLSNSAFESLLARGPQPCRTSEELVALFAQPALARRLVGQVRAEQRSGRVALGLPGADGLLRPVAMRGEPVLSARGGLLGMIFIIEDLTAVRLAEEAWDRLQSLLGAPARAAGNGDFDPVISAIYTNASLAAMDMADTSHSPGLAPLLNEVEDATSRATSLYRRLMNTLPRADSGARPDSPTQAG